MACKLRSSHLINHLLLATSSFLQKFYDENFSRGLLPFECPFYSKCVMYISYFLPLSLAFSSRAAKVVPDPYPAPGINCSDWQLISTMISCL